MNPGMFFRLCPLALLPTMVFAQTSTTVNVINVQVANQVDTAVGVDGRLQLPMSTSFQLATGSDDFFTQAPAAASLLNALFPHDTRVQAVAGGIPLTAPTTWDFTGLNELVPPIQGTGDHSPEFQIASAPSFMNDTNGYILSSNFSAFAAMSADVVKFYNTGGFDASGQHFQSPTPYPITWWGIFNEPNGNGLTAQQYVSLYNTVVPAMAQADPTIKFVALELSDVNQAAEAYMPAFVTGVTAPVNALATHFYSTCNQADTDITLFATIPGFASEVQYIYSQLATKPSLAGVPVWVTENNVNSDYENADGFSNCNGTPFVLDPRGTSPFFAAWRSLVFSELGEAGAQALYHWSFGTNAQYGEVNATASPYLSYWVDYYLSHWLPSPPGQDILQVSESGCCLWFDPIGKILGLDTNTLALRNVDGSVVILMSNHAIANQKDNNGTGLIRNFTLDLSALGTFTSATLVTLDATTPTTGPALVSVTPAAQMVVTLPGYGAALLRLANTQPVLTAAGIANGASYHTGTVAPGEILALFGTNIGPTTPASLTLVNPNLVANSLEGVHVLFDGVPAPVLFASAGQVNVVAPNSIAGNSTTQVQVEYLGALSAPITLPVAATVPGLFTQNASGDGPGAIVNVSSGTVNSASSPASPGDWVSIYVTGAGVTTPASVDGLVTFPPYPVANAHVSVTIGGIPCDVNYAGAAPGYVAGLLQINAQVPAGVTPGSNVPVAVTIGTAVSQSGVTLAVE
jgi:uncharacterized protein (TIGR03437 family)